VPFLGAAASKDKDYPRRRDEAWFRLAERLGELDLPADEELAADLLAPRYSLDSSGRRVVEPKSETKRRLRRSPDRGDAVVMAFAIDRAATASGRTHSPFKRGSNPFLGPRAASTRSQVILPARDGRGGVEMFG
jgi:hypothetical protein